jgi:uncharacterized protein involved in exopolysaccharide biosynthesis
MLQNNIIQKSERIDFEEEINNKKEITLFALFLTLWRYRILILSVTISAMVISLGVSIVSLMLPPEKSFLPNLYTSRADMLINNANSQGSGITAAINASGLGGLASMAGLNVTGGPTFSSLVVYLAGSNTLLDSIVGEFDIAARYKIKDHRIGNSRKALKKRLRVECDDANGVFTIGFTDYDPVFACEVVNYCVDYLSNRFESLGLDKNILQKKNLEKGIETAYQSIRDLEDEVQKLERSATTLYSGPVQNITLETRRINMELNAQQQIYTQLKVQLELVNTSIASETPVFQILEVAQVPDLKSGPGRGMLCIIVSLGAFFFSAFLGFALSLLENIRNDEESMERFRAVSGKGKGRGQS